MKLNSMKFGVMLIAASLSFGTVTSCKKKGCTDPEALNYNDNAKKDDGSCEYEPVNPVGNEITKAGYITANETWTANNVYVLTGKVVVDNGVTLTIEPGTIIKGEQGTGTLASALIVAQGGNINAVGTASAPIIFTSILDNIQPGELTGTNLDENDQGLWGGIIVLGYAPISAQNGDVLSQIEGIPTTDPFGAFGGNDAADNSGTMAYVSIRHGGALIGAGNEINGLTLGGVGTGTSISNIEIVANLDDGIEFFGGTVNVSNLLIGFQGDDGVDIDMNYAGTVTDFTVVCGPNSDEAMEIDGPEGSTYTTGMFTLQNGHAYLYGGSGHHADFKSKAQGYVNNVLFGEPKIRASYQNACVDSKEDAFTHLINGTPTLIFTGSEFTTPSVYTTSDDGLGNACSVSATDQTAAENAMVSGTATTPSTTGFNWTWMAANGRL